MELYKHLKNNDVAVEVIKSFYVKEKKALKMKVMWWNIGRCHEPWSMNITQRIEIPVDLWIKDWIKYDCWPCRCGSCFMDCAKNDLRSMVDALNKDIEEGE